MNQDDRASYDLALRRSRLSAYQIGEFVGQESFMRTSEIRELAEHAGISSDVSVLDLCCGVAGPGRFITREFGCMYLGVDSSESAITIARARADGLGCQFEKSLVPPLPQGRYDVVLLLETMLAFADKQALVQEVSSVLRVGGRFAFTLEEGQPLTAAEREAMPDSDTVWLITLPQMLTYLTAAGLDVRWHCETSHHHQVVAESLTNAYRNDASHIAGIIGRDALDDLLAAHLLWSGWLRSGRVRKFSLVAQKTRE